MRLSALPPVRRAVPLRRGDPAIRLSMERFFGNRRITLCASGTAALSHAIARCAAQRSVSAPEVIIPAYGCPDLVSACVHASVYPRLVDIAPSHWSYELRELESALSPNTVAVIAVNLLGLGDGAAELIQFCKEKDLPVIQDSAQYLPRESIRWTGDYIVLSFGRGKPLNLLHGGALIGPPEQNGGLARGAPHAPWRDRLLGTRAAAIAFNILTRPDAYRILSALPGTGLGDVKYKPLAQSAMLPDRAWKQVGIAFELYRKHASYRRDLWTDAIEEWRNFGIVPLDCPNSPLPQEPLRIALLAPDRGDRDSLVERLNRAGLGASRFYGTDLPAIASIPAEVKRQRPFPNASALAGRLFTLPTHQLVTAESVGTARNLVLEWHRSRRLRPLPQEQP